MLARRAKTMRLYKSQTSNMLHYVTTVTHDRVPVFRSARACEIFVGVLCEMRERGLYKLIGYVVMPDHAHLIVNPQDASISSFMRRLKGITARRIVDWLQRESHHESLAKLTLLHPQKQRHSYAVWLKDYSAIDLWSPRLIGQKLNYIHLNPVRAKLCEHPAQWRWSSYRAYFPHADGDVPVEVDWRAYWNEKPQLETAGIARL